MQRGKNVEQTLRTCSFGKNVAAERIASNLSIFTNRSIVLFDKISSIMYIDSVKLGGSEFRGENVPPGNELSDGTLSRLA